MMMIITLRAGLARAGGLEMSSHSPAIALEVLDKPQGRNPVGKQCGSSVAPCLHRVISPQVRGSQFSARAGPLGMGRAKSQALLQGCNSL